LILRKRIAFREDVAKYLLEDEVVGESLVSSTKSQSEKDAKTVGESSSLVCDNAFLRNKAEESEADSLFSRNSIPMELDNVKSTDKQKGKRSAANMSGLDATNDASVPTKKAFKKRVAVDRELTPGNNQSTASSYNRKAEDSEQDSPFSRCSSAPNPQNDMDVALPTKISTTTAHPKSLDEKGSLSNKKSGAAKKDSVAKQNQSSQDEKVKTNAVISSGHKQGAVSTKTPKHKKYESSKDTSVDLPIRVLSDEEAWALLSTEKYGFTFQNNAFYCLPGVVPGDSRFREGYDYFTDLKALRKNICAFGIPDPRQHIIEDEDLLNWVCLSISSMVDGRKTVPPYVEFKTFTSAWGVLMKIGFKYGGGLYYLPNKERMFDSGYDIWCHLSRFGIPQTASLDKIDEQTLLALEMKLADCPSDKRQLW